MNSSNKVIDLIKESYKYFYYLLQKEKQDFYSIGYLKQIVQIIDMKPAHSNYDELIDETELIKKLKLSFELEINMLLYLLEQID